jgi:hypothetical protein
MFYGKKISRFIGNKFVKVYQTIKEYTNLLVIFLQFMEREMSLFRWLYHVIHLTKEIYEQYRLMIEVLKSMNLLLIEILHLMRCDDLVIVQVNDREPVFETASGSFVFF